MDFLKKCLMATISLYLIASTPTFAEEPQCVTSPTGVCTRDINACGLPSSCGCPTNYNYNAAIGQCVISLVSVPSAEHTDLSNTKCVQDPPAGATCKRDINICGNSSGCSCTTGFSWNGAAGKCIKTL